MKKCIILMGLTSIVLASCTMQEESPVVVSDGSHIVLSGESYTATKVSIGEKDGDVYPLLWYTGDVIGIYSTDGTWSGERAELYSASVGSSSGLFQTVNDIVPSSAMDLVITYPATNVSYKDGVVTGTVLETQSQRSPGSSIHVGNSCVAFAETNISAGQTEGVKFSLNHQSAFVELVVSSTTYSNYYLTGVQLYAEGKTLSGTLTYDIGSGEVEVSGSESVKVNISSTSLLSDSQTVYLTALPCDLSNEELLAFVSLSSYSGDEKVTLPVSLGSGKFKAGCLNIIEMNLDGGSSIIWYDPIETRDLLDAWAYGAQNTYFIEQPEAEDGHINISVKARGDFSKVVEPKYYGLLTLSSETSTINLVYLKNADGDVVTSRDELIPVNEEDCSIDVYCYSQATAGDSGRWAVVGLYDEDENIIWSFMIWKYLAGDDPQTIQYTSDIAVLDRTLGLPYSNKLAEQKKTFNGPAAYFQWGRKDPSMWDNTGVWDYYYERVTPTGTTLADVIANPTITNCYDGNTKNWYMVDTRTDLWGCSSNTSCYDENAIGHKTIYDPCPKGYRVCDGRVFTYVMEHEERWETDMFEETGRNDQMESSKNPDSPFYDNGESCVAVMASDGTYDFWPYAGARWCGQGANTAQPWGNRTGNYKSRGLMYYGNCMDPSVADKATVWEYCYYSSEFKDNTQSEYAPRAFTVRCQAE